MDFNVSPAGAELLQKVTAFVEEKILPIEAEYFKTLKGLDDRWVVLPIIKE